MILNLSLRQVLSPSLINEKAGDDVQVAGLNKHSPNRFIMGPVLRETVPSVVFRFYIARNPRALNFYCTSERRTVVFVMFRSVHRHVEIFYCRNVEGYGENLLALEFLLQVRMKARRFWHCENEPVGPVMRLLRVRRTYVRTYLDLMSQYEWCIQILVMRLHVSAIHRINHSVQEMHLRPIPSS